MIPKADYVSAEPKEKHWTQVDSRFYDLLLKLSSAATLYCEEATNGFHSDGAQMAFGALNKVLDDLDAL